jgi:hypothetical protein
MPGRYETYALQTKRLHPECWARLAPFLTPAPYRMSNEAIWVLVQGGILGAIGLRNGAMVVGNTIRVRPGLLDANTMLYGSLWSWSQPQGIANWAHEAFHVHQWRRDRWTYYGGIFTGMVNSWLHGSPYDHSRVGPEREAILFERYVRSVLEAQEHQEKNDA